ncbi:hypothetical protein KC640_03095 [Candidatus Dojkabacteria bacterium]|uniref:Glucose-6-phosphate isomerase n=1 Tax=Candidatus Dojkabacteria bacterium TaxID=2099670 RepID=A0A955I6G9_9BACT|nr:hypothetical protein [Candidatus Dojkabacteria bacterium]
MPNLRSEGLYAHKIGNYGISAQTEEANSHLKSEVLPQVISQLNTGKYGFANHVREPKFISQINEVLDQISWAKNLVVVGIGGSDLGGRTIQNALDVGQGKFNVVFTGDTTDPTEFDWLFAKVKLPSSVFNIVSKSGGTMETMAYYAYLKQECQKRFKKNWQKHFVFTTDDDSGALFAEAEREGITTLQIPDDVGGRFSVLTPVGLLPAAAMGADLQAMLSGAAAGIDSLVDAGEASIAFRIAREQYLLYTQGLKISVLMPYSSRLIEFARWQRQLWAESLGKEGKGILPIAAKGPADQHSQLQYYTQGTTFGNFYLLKVVDHQSDRKIEKLELLDNEYLSGKNFAELINTEVEATYESLLNAGRPAAILELDKVDEWQLGFLFMTYMLAVTFLGEFLQINAFDQPGVEDSKHIMYHLLGRAGF